MNTGDSIIKGIQSIHQNLGTMGVVFAIALFIGGGISHEAKTIDGKRTGYVLMGTGFIGLMAGVADVHGTSAAIMLTLGLSPLIYWAWHILKQEKAEIDNKKQ